LQHGTKAYVEGPSGAGKSSLLRLLGNLAMPAAGKVHHAPPLRTDHAQPRRQSQICCVNTQSPVLSGSLRRALTLGTRTRPDDERIEAVASGFGLQVVLDRLGGLDGRVAESGNNLSRSERCRVLLARAALSDADLVLVDDLDELVDELSAKALQAWLLGTSATVVYVSKDPELYLAADEIWHLNGGQLSVYPFNATA
jgi:ABC-type transport system involved in cytochrome bd biosynthesis fused ATPase/permease subunit